LDEDLECVAWTCLPFVIPCSRDGLIGHLPKVADAVRTPVDRFDIPARTQNLIEPENAAKPANIGIITGIKYSGGVPKTMFRYQPPRSLVASKRHCGLPRLASAMRCLMC
jgi:dihydrodipicolinate synthase/N-acetylneuraminate lyase